VSWIAHNRLVLDWDRYGTYAGTQQAMNTALGCVLRAFGYPVTLFVSGGAARHRPPGNGGGTMTALALAPDTRISHEPAAAAGVDRAIRVSTAVAVLAVAGIAAYVSYWHAYAVVCAHGETGVTARLEPATIDGLVYASSMVNLYAARHRLPVPALARWLLALGGPCGPGSGPALRLTGTGDCRQPERRHQRRRSGRLPRQCPGGSAVV
jgi:hypothetical protein